MYENVIAAALSYLWRAKAVRRDGAAEKDFYERFAEPYPRWFAGLLRIANTRQTTTGGIAAAHETGSDRSTATSKGQNLDRSRPMQRSQPRLERCEGPAPQCRPVTSSTAANQAARE